MATLPPLGRPNPQLAVALKQLSAAKFGHPRAKVEADIFGRLRTAEPAKPAFGMPASNGPLNAPFGPTAPQKQASGSFLDEWLAKRQAPASIGPSVSSPWGKNSTTPPSQPGGMAPPPAYNPSLSLGNPVAGKSVKYHSGQQGKNISSNELEQEEALKIAERLKQQLQHDTPSSDNAGTALPAAEPRMAPDSDTISIDPDGNMTRQEQEAAPQSTDTKEEEK